MKTAGQPEPSPLAMPYPPNTALLKDTHTAIKNLATAADTALSTNAIYVGYKPFTSNASGVFTVTTDLTSVIGAVFTFVYGTGRPHPYTPTFAMLSSA